MLRRIPFVALALTVLLLSIVLLPGIQAYALTATLPARTNTPTTTITRTPTAACVAPTYYVTVTPSVSTVQVGDQITVSAYTNVGIADYTLYITDNATGTTQSATDPIFTPISNATMRAPASWTLTAVRAGSVSFRVGVYGEIQTCSGGSLAWIFTSKSGTSGNVTVNPTSTPTPVGALPDLTVLSITEYSYTLPIPTLNPQGCWTPASSSKLGLRVTIQNIGAANAGSFVLDLNGYHQSGISLAAGQTLALDFPIPLTRSRIATVDSTGLVAESNETNNTYSLTLTAATSTSTGTAVATMCTARTATATPTITATVTKTLTPTLTIPPVGGTCSPVSATVTAPFTKDGAGTFCWQSSNLGTYANSWNLSALTINGVNYVNTYVPAASYPAKINGYWYVVYSGNYAWSHFEAK